MICQQWHWLCSQRNESRSAASWLGSWFELRAFTCIANAFPITIRICALRGKILFLLRSPRWLTHAWLQCTSKMHRQESRSERALRSHVLESGFLRGSRSKTPFFGISKLTHFKSLIWNGFAFTGAKIRLSNQERAERDFGTWFSPCEHSLCLTTPLVFYLMLPLMESQCCNGVWDMR